MRRTPQLPVPNQDRRGTTLVIVLALLGLLSLLGVVFFLFAAQERENAEIFLESAKEPIADSDDGIDHFLESLIRGPRSTNYNSALSGGRHSIIGHLLGGDSLPHSGSGIEVAIDSNGIPRQDLNGNGIIDAGELPANGLVDRLNINDTLGAHAGIARDLRLFPTPDAGYVYPDVNSPFISYVADVPWFDAADNMWREMKVVIPSFLRPQILRNSRANAADDAVTEAQWYQDASLAARGFRPNPGHLYVTSEGRTLVDPITNTPVRRFLDDNNPADTTAINSLKVATGGFPLEPELNDQNPMRRGELGVWTLTSDLLSAAANASERLELLSQYELDVDNDRDGIPDSIWMDFGFPSQEDPDPSADGATYTLIYAPQITDMDGLINLNIHGNLGHFVGNSMQVGLPVSGTRNEFLSASNTGISPSEVNPSYALMRDLTGGDFQDHAAIFGGAPSNLYEQANMEWMWILTGRGDIENGEVTDIYAGRWGDADRLYQALVALAGSGSPDPFSNAVLRLLPRPGIADSDDDNNIAEGTFGFGPLGHAHPLDFSGTGAFYSGMDARLPNLFYPAGGRMPYLQYRSQRDPNTTLGVPGLTGYPLFSTTNALANVPVGPTQHHWWGLDGLRSAVFGSDDVIQLPNLNNPLFDGPMEVIVEPDFARRPFDEVYTYGDLLEMHMDASEADNSTGEVSRRLSTLISHAFHRDARENRERFTTQSFDLKHRVSRSPLGPDRRPFTADDGLRPWEYSADRSLPRGVNDAPAPNGLFEFPPQFGSSVVFSSREIGTAVTGGDGSVSEDPFRPPARRTLRAEDGDPSASFGQRKLSINHIIDVERLPNRVADVLRGTLEYRQLTEHPIGISEDGSEDTTVLNLTAVPSGPNVAFPPQTRAQQEYWARRDRQKMARDIYVLLYSIGGGNDNRNYTGSNLAVELDASAPAANSFAIYNEEQLREMAQLAVNIVDAIDPDDTITKFEYDKNLGDTLRDGAVLRSGWNLDDNPYDNDALSWTAATPSRLRSEHYPEDTAERGVVFGAEKQKLAISESLGIRILEPDNTPSPDPRLYDNGETLHFFLELQNLHNVDIPLSTSVAGTGEEAGWRLRQVFVNDAGVAANGTTVEFTRNAGSVTTDRPFVIAATNQTSSLRSADVYLDHDLDQTSFTSIAPAVARNAATMEPDPLCDLDLGHQNHRTSRFSFNSGQTLSAAGQEGEFFSSVWDETNPRSVGFTVVLERRQNLSLPRLNLPDNQWVEVDRMFVDFRELNLEQSGPLATTLQNLTSVERNEVLDTQNAQTGPMRNGFANSLTDFRSSPFTFWPAHFDRPLTSVGELLNLPLLGPRSLAFTYGTSVKVPGIQTTSSAAGALYTATPDYRGARNPDLNNTNHALMFTPAVLRTPNTGLLFGANAKFLQPVLPGSLTLPAGQTTADLSNRWYRLFEFVQVPTRTHRMLGNVLQTPRVPGKLSLNMMRHPEVFAGLLDEQFIADYNTAVGAIHKLPDADRLDWWLRFLQSRDGRKAINGSRFILPGLAGAARNQGTASTDATVSFSSRPFRSYDRLARRDDPRRDLEDTLLRADFVDGNNDFVDDQEPAPLGRRLLEIGTEPQYGQDLPDPTGNASTVRTTPQMRHRLLSKIMNNTTTNSNVFLVTVTIGHFETIVDPTNGAVRIGGEYDINHDGNLDDADRRKVMFVIDRSDVFNAYDAGTGQLDWRRLVKHQVIIQ